MSIIPGRQTAMGQGNPHSRHGLRGVHEHVDTSDGGMVRSSKWFLSERPLHKTPVVLVVFWPAVVVACTMPKEGSGLGMSTKSDWPEVEPKQIQVRRAAERGHANHGWLDTWHHF